MANVKSEFDEKRTLITADIKKLIPTGNWSVDVPVGATYWRIDKSTAIWQTFDPTGVPPSSTTPALFMNVRCAHQQATVMSDLVSSGWEEWTGAIAWKSNGTAIASNFEYNALVTISDGTSCIT
jgi:hypothetical protein